MATGNFSCIWPNHLARLALLFLNGCALSIPQTISKNIQILTKHNKAVDSVVVCCSYCNENNFSSATSVFVLCNIAF